MIIYNEEKEDIVDERHICYYTVSEGRTIILMEIVEVKLKHPAVKPFAYAHKYDSKYIDRFDRAELGAAATVLLEAAQNNERIILNDGKSL